MIVDHIFGEWSWNDRRSHSFAKTCQNHKAVHCMIPKIRDLWSDLDLCIKVGCSIKDLISTPAKNGILDLISFPLYPFSRGKIHIFIPKSLDLRIFDIPRSWAFRIYGSFHRKTALCTIRHKRGVIGKMIADHDRDLIVQDFEKVIVSDRRSQFGKSIVSDRRSRKMWSDLALLATKKD